MIAVCGRWIYHINYLSSAPVPCEVLDDSGRWIFRCGYDGRIWTEPDAGARRAEEAYAGRALPLNAKIGN